MIKHEFTSRNPIYWLIFPLLLLIGLPLLIFSIPLCIQDFKLGIFFAGFIGLLFSIGGLCCLLGLIFKYTWWSCISEDSIQWGFGYKNKLKENIAKKDIKDIYIDDKGEGDFIFIKLHNGRQISVKEANTIFGDLKKLRYSLEL